MTPIISWEGRCSVGRRATDVGESIRTAESVVKYIGLQNPKSANRLNEAINFWMLDPQ